LLLSKKAVRPVEKAWQKQLDFTADASHELRTPIAVIQTNLELVIDSPKETIESQMKWLKNIEAENKRMAKLVEDLLILSRVDTDQQALEIETFMLDEVVLEVLAPFEPIASGKNIELEVHVNDKIAFSGDRKRIKQLFVILVDNALNYTDSTGAVTVSLDHSEKEITLTVSDTGHGIESEHLDKIFDRFYRVTKTRKLNQDGSGLGLSIAKWIVQEHGGTIGVTSTLSVGTTFTARLPNSN
jgi:signal transduction histidine kinase